MHPGGSQRPNRRQYPPRGYPPPGYQPLAPTPPPYIGGYPPPRQSGGSGCGLAALIVGVVMIVALAVVLIGGFFALSAVGDAVTPSTTAQAGGATTPGAPTTDGATDAPSTSSIPAPSGEASLGSNPLFDTSVPAFAPTRCDVRGLPDEPEQGAAFFATELTCLDRGWRPMIEGAGFAFTSPSMKIITTDQLTTPCGSYDFTKENLGAFYCSSDSTIYILYAPTGGLRAVGPDSVIGLYITLLAHEYAHHVQNLTGTFNGYGERVTKAGGLNTPAGQENRRRMELQGACFAGMATGGIYRGGGGLDEADYPRILYAPPVKKNNTAWWRSGYVDNNVAKCNTWTAAAEDVSDN